MVRPIHVEEHAERLARRFTVVKPDGAGPHPVVVQLHGCGGVRRFMTCYADVALAQGVKDNYIRKIA